MQLPKQVLALLDCLQRCGYQAYIVGGPVRDTLLNRPVHDWDLCTNATPEEMLSCFPEETVIPTGLKHGTVTVLKDGVPYEITTFRKEAAYQNHRRPETVSFVQELSQDLSRRDFTINAMAYHPKTGLVDLYGAQQDLAQKVIRCVGNANMRLEEDALRILRALRFSAQLGFSLDRDTAKAVLEKKTLLMHISVPRITDELTKLICGDSVESVLLEYGTVLCTVLPQLTPIVENKVLWRQIVKEVGAVPPQSALRFAMLLRRTQQAQEILTALQVSNVLRNGVTDFIALETIPQTPSPQNVRRQMARWGMERLQMLPYVCTGKDVSAFLVQLELQRNACVTREALKINGKDVLRAGVVQGVQVGEILESLLDQVIEGTLPNEREILLAQITPKQGL